MDTLFHAIVGGDQIVRGKPDPEMALLALALLNAPPTDAALVGDTVHDVAMARAAGIPAYAVSYGVHDRAMLEQSGAGAVVDHFEELAALLD